MELLVITPGTDVMQDCIFHLLVASTGEVLASHLCSHAGFAMSDLYSGRPERIEEFQKRFGEFEVKYIDETDITDDILLERNKVWAKENNLTN